MDVIDAVWLAKKIPQPTPESIFNTINNLIKSSKIPSGAMLPPIKQLAKELQISPSTISAAWKMLRNKKLILGNGRQGIKVIKTSDILTPLRFAKLNDFLLEPILFDLTYTMPDSRLLPNLESAMLNAVHVKNLNDYNREPITPSLLAAVKPSWPYDAEAFIALHSAYEAMDLLLRTLIIPDAIIAVEMPASLSMLDVLKKFKVKIIPVNCDNNGPIVEQLHSILKKKPHAFIYQPRAHTPCGHSISKKRLQELMKLFKNSSTLLIEYDLFGDLAKDASLSLGSYYPQQTVHIRSYLKSYGPDIALTVLSAPQKIVQEIEDERGVTVGWNSRLLQQALTWLILDSESQKQLKQTQRYYITQRNKLIRALNERGITVPPDQGMLSLWLPVKSENLALIILANKKISVVGNSHFGLSSPSYIRVSTNMIPDNKIDYIADALAQVLAL